MSGPTSLPKSNGEPSPPPDGEGEQSRGLSQSATVAGAHEASQARREITTGLEHHAPFTSSVQRSFQTLNEIVTTLQDITYSTIDESSRNEHSRMLTQTLNNQQAILARLEMQSYHVPFTIMELGEFDGSSTGLPRFMPNLRYLFGTCPNDTVANHLMRAIPRTLSGTARLWYAAQSAAFKEHQLGDLDGWEKQLCKMFPQDRQQLQATAIARTWDQVETISKYTWHKIMQIEEAFPDYTDEEIVSAVIAGLPPRFALLVEKEDGSWPTRAELLSVLQRQEVRWRRAGP